MFNQDIRRVLAAPVGVVLGLAGFLLSVLAVIVGSVIARIPPRRGAESVSRPHENSPLQNYKHLSRQFSTQYRTDAPPSRSMTGASREKGMTHLNVVEEEQLTDNSNSAASDNVDRVDANDLFRTPTPSRSRRRPVSAAYTLPPDTPIQTAYYHPSQAKTSTSHKFRLRSLRTPWAKLPKIYRCASSPQFTTPTASPCPSARSFSVSVKKSKGLRKVSSLPFAFRSGSKKRSKSTARTRPYEPPYNFPPPQIYKQDLL